MRGIFGELFGREVKLASDSTVYGPPEAIWHDLFGGRTTKSGVTVTWKNALEVTTALRCGTILAEAICSVPFKVYQRQGVKGRPSRREAREHKLYDLLATAPNPWQTSFEFRETIGLHLAFCQNAYAFLNRVRGEIVEIMPPFRPGDVTVTRGPNWELTYRVNSPDGSQQTFSADAIWHIRARSWDSVTGMETIALAREAIGLAIATEESHARMHDKAIRPSGVLSIEGELTEEQFVRWRRWVDAYYSGIQNAGKALILDRAAKWQSQQMTGVDAQHVQTRGFQIEEICRAFNVLPIMVGYTGDKNATFASSEQMFLAHVVHTVRPLHRRLEASTDFRCLTKADRQAGFYTGFVDAELLRGDHKARAEYYKIALGGGNQPAWMSPNDVCGLEEMPPFDGGDSRYVPVNMAPIGPDGMPMVPAKPAPAPAPADPAQE